jgi:hypothetical protein
VPALPSGPAPLTTRRTLGLLDVVALLASAAIVALAVSSAFAGSDIRATSDKIEAADEALAQRDYGLWGQRLFSALQDEPASVTAQARFSCVLWKLGYQDHAVAFLQSMVATGQRWQTLDEGPGGCWWSAPHEHGVRHLAAEPVGLVYAAPTSLAARLYEVFAFKSARQQRWPEAMFAVACINHLEGLRLMSAGQFAQVALIEAIPAELVKCDEDFRGHYLRREGGVELMPKDFRQRVFVPDRSPVPAKTRQVLP